MENRDRDKVSERTTPTDAGKVNRETSEKQSKHDEADFGQKIGRAEEPFDNGNIGDSTSGRH